jgi:hypothetical protein
MTRGNTVGTIRRCGIYFLSQRHDWTGLRMRLKIYPETSYLSHNITSRHNPKKLHHQFHRGEGLRLQTSDNSVVVPANSRDTKHFLNASLT